MSTLETSWPLRLIKANSFTVKLTTAVSTSMSHLRQEERERERKLREGGMRKKNVHQNDAMHLKVATNLLKSKCLIKNVDEKIDNKIEIKTV